MNALEDIERQLRASVAARDPEQSGAPLADGAGDGHRMPSRWSGGRWRLTAAAALALAIAGVVLLVGFVGPGASPGPSGAAAATLERLARIAASGPSVVPAPGQYLYVESDNYYSANQMGRAQTDCITYAADRRQVWKGADGSGLMRDTTGPSRYTSGHDRSVCRAMKAHRFTAGTSNSWFAPNCFSPSPLGNITALPTDPRALLHKIEKMEGVRAFADFDSLGSLLQESDASPALRAAVYRAAALIPGVELLGPVRDHGGRRGLGVALQTRQEREELIFNPRTAALMGMVTTSTLPGLSGWTVYRAPRVVDRLPYRPPAALTPPCQSAGAGYGHVVHGDDVMSGRPAK